MSDEDLLFGWDEDRPWIWASGEEGWVVDLPGSARPLFDNARTRGASLARVDEPPPSDDTPTATTWRRDDVTDLLVAAGRALRGADDGAIAGDGLVGEWEAAAQLLAAALEAMSR